MLAAGLTFISCGRPACCSMLLAGRESADEYHPWLINQKDARHSITRGYAAETAKKGVSRSRSRHCLCQPPATCRAREHKGQQVHAQEYGNSTVVLKHGLHGCTLALVGPVPVPRCRGAVQWGAVSINHLQAHSPAFAPAAAAQLGQRHYHLLQ